MPVGQTNRRAFIAGLGGAAAWPVVGRGQQSVTPIIGFLGAEAYEPWAVNSRFISKSSRP